MRDGLGTRLRRTRRARGFSQQHIASRAGISRQAVSAIETGIADPSLRVAFALAERGLRLVNREPGAEARTLLDRELASAGIPASQLPGYDTRAAGHLHLAAAIAAGLADAGIASKPAARAYDLAFVPLAAEHFDLVIPARLVSTPEVQGLLKVMSSAWLLDQLASLPGYDPARCGEQIATLPSRQLGIHAGCGAIAVWAERSVVISRRA